MFRKVLIANRGEIAIRVIRACRELGINTVAVYSEADINALHVQYSDESYCIGPEEPLHSYLNIDKIIEVTEKSKCDAIHPGYGFLSQIPAFARACEENNIEFIGPSSKVLQRMGNKVEARKTAVKAGVPVIPGNLEPSRNKEEAFDIATKLGYPVLVKAVYGGGGKGMRMVRDENEMERILELAILEAEASFGGQNIYVEKLLPTVRHVEFQVLADKIGNIIHLGERECSLQRRYQKLVEETPSTFVTEGLRRDMGKAALEIAGTANYTSAGTVEFLIDQNKRYHFLEMNTRLQVEHLITEMVTGVDIVKTQIEIATGQRLKLTQKNIVRKGHAINCRINAEDPNRGFVPSPGKIESYHQPGGPGIRVDTHLYTGHSISVFYDPLIMKLAAWGNNRREAIQRMKNALNETAIVGVKTNIPFLRKIMDDQHFLKGLIHTRFIEERINKLQSEQTVKEEEAAAIIAVLTNHIKKRDFRAVIPRKKTKAVSLWKLAGRMKRTRRTR